MIWLCRMVIIRWSLGVLRRNVLHCLTQNNILSVPKWSRIANQWVRVLLMIPIDTPTLISRTTSYSMRTRTYWLSFCMRWRGLVRITSQTLFKGPRHVPSLWVILGLTFLSVYLFTQVKVHLEIGIMCGGWNAAKMVSILILLQCASMQKISSRVFITLSN